MLLLGWPELESLKWVGMGGLLLVRGSEREREGGLGAPVDGTDISGQVVLKQ